MGTAPVHYSTLQSMIKSSSSNLSDGDPTSPSAASISGWLSMWYLWRCCCDQSRQQDDFVVNVDVGPSGLVKPVSALQKRKTMHDLDEMNYFTVLLTRDANGTLDLSLEKSDPDYTMVKEITKPVTD
eukprot:Skav231227  [mRNA]  locus=scaffold813:213125:216321:+ [translate_table: standard]